MIEINLTKAQMKELRSIFDEMEEAYKEYKPGMILAQVMYTELALKDKGSIKVRYVDYDIAIQIQDIFRNAKSKSLA